MSTEKLHRLIALVREHDVGLYSWLATADADRRAGMDFEMALGLRGPRAIRERDAALVEAATIIDPDGELSLHARAGDLATRIRRFESIQWPRLQDDPDAYRAGINGVLLRAFRTGMKVPSGQRQLYSILLQFSSADCRNDEVG